MVSAISLDHFRYFEVVDPVAKRYLGDRFRWQLGSTPGDETSRAGQLGDGRYPIACGGNMVDNSHVGALADRSDALIEGLCSKAFEPGHSADRYIPECGGLSDKACYLKYC